MAVKTQQVRLQGSPICSGIAIGSPFVYLRQDDQVSEYLIEAGEIEGEIKKFRAAISESRSEVERLAGQLQTEGAVEGAAILETHLQLLEDPALTTQVEDQIRETRKNSAFLLRQVVTSYEQQFARMQDQYFRERSKDLKDVSRRVFARLRQDDKVSLAQAPLQAIVFADELVPSDTAEANGETIGAFVTQMGGDTSHAAIMAKARGIPYVANVDLSDYWDLGDATVIVDGRTGQVIIHPTEATLSKYRELEKELAAHYKRFEELGKYPSQTIDGYHIPVTANVEMCHELDSIHKYGSDGIGLFRSEYLCLSRDVFPSEEEQYEIYRQIVEGMNGLPVTIRTFDIGGDKFQGMPGASQEVNPFLGCRAIRLMLKEHEAFKTQLRAILRASAHGQVKILFPMVSGIAELREAKSYVHEVERELKREGIPFCEKVPIGCMIEVPSAAVTCDLLTRECDFLSIGTNDLVQYSLAVDRSNQAMNYLYTPAHPSVLRLIRLIVMEANKNKIPVTLCGEVATDPRFIPLLMGLGVNGFSVASRYLPIVKNAIRSTSIVQAVKLAEEVLSLHTSLEVLETLIKQYQDSLSVGSIPSI